VAATSFLVTPALRHQATKQARADSSRLYQMLIVFFNIDVVLKRGMLPPCHLGGPRPASSHQLISMDSPKPTIARQSSGMKNIPSFNDFGEQPKMQMGLGEKQYKQAAVHNAACQCRLCAVSPGLVHCMHLAFRARVTSVCLWLLINTICSHSHQ
jgi:hypothetical protein